MQINTGAGCHLDADMVAAGLRALDPPAGSVVVIENVGNLVCPALFDLGEHSKVVITSVTEGAEKPIKYPQMFGVADLVVLNKIDLLPYVEFDTARHAADLARVSPHADVLRLSATTGGGVHSVVRLAPRPPARVIDVRLSGTTGRLPPLVAGGTDCPHALPAPRVTALVPLGLAGELIQRPDRQALGALLLVLTACRPCQPSSGTLCGTTPS